MLENTNINNEENITENPTSRETEISDDSTAKGHLYVVSTPIGNRNDITQRAISTLKHVDLVVCEEIKLGARLLHQLNLRNELDNLNEQNEDLKTFELLNMLKEGKSLGLISDCGTPVFADPGYMLVKRAIDNNIPVTVVPGASSIMTALVRSSFPMKSFIFAGFLSRTPSERLEEFKQLAEEPRTVCLLETPYRLLPLLEAAATIIPNRRAYIGFNLTMPFETHHYGTFQELFEHFSEKRIKAEFVICFEGTEQSIIPEKRNRFIPGKMESMGRSNDRGDRKFSKDRDDRRFSKDRDDRRFSKDRDDRKFSKDRDDRKFSKDRDDRKFSKDRDDRKFSKDRDDRKFSKDRDDRRFSKNRNDRKFSKDRDDRNKYKKRDDKPYGKKSDSSYKSKSSSSDNRESYTKDITKEVLAEFERKK